ncbi:hypothetical protein J3459_006549 [Metarhizium acridum]|nr:hypothetical protein J3459_006549 [Metarhizium acridum]
MHHPSGIPPTLGLTRGKMSLPGAKAPEEHDSHNIVPLHVSLQTATLSSAMYCRQTVTFLSSLSTSSFAILVVLVRFARNFRALFPTPLPDSSGTIPRENNRV